MGTNGKPHPAAPPTQEEEPRLISIRATDLRVAGIALPDGTAGLLITLVNPVAQMTMGLDYTQAVTLADGLRAALAEGAGLAVAQHRLEVVER